MTQSQLQTDIVIIGGGIAGLWTMQLLKSQGFKVILLENVALGAGQTIKSQGIIHGGLKYALTGSQNEASTALKDIPAYWQSCLSGDGDVDLSSVKILSQGQYMWSCDKLTGGIASLFASNAMRGAVTAIAKADQPLVIRNSNIKGKLYKLAEIVLNIPSLISALAKPLINDCIKIDQTDTCNFSLDPAGNVQAIAVTSAGVPLQITAQRYIFTAGVGNANLQHQISAHDTMQLRPLHMVIVKAAELKPLFGHCVGLSTVPRITITTHIAKDHTPVWYLGGKIAEEGVNRDSAAQIRAAQQELKVLFPKLDLSNAQWASFYVDRAEAKQSDGSKPSSFSIFCDTNCIAAWPTKLALAPVLASQILTTLQEQNILPNLNLPNYDLTKYQRPALALPIWEQLL